MRLNVWEYSVVQARNQLRDAGCDSDVLEQAVERYEARENGAVEVKNASPLSIAGTIVPCAPKPVERLPRPPRTPRAPFSTLTEVEKQMTRAALRGRFDEGW